MERGSRYLGGERGGREVINQECDWIGNNRMDGEEMRGEDHAERVHQHQPEFGGI